MACATKFTDELAHAHRPHRSAYEYQRANYVPGAEEEGESVCERAHECVCVCVCFISFTERYTAGIVGYIALEHAGGMGSERMSWILTGDARGQRYTRGRVGMRG